jgi:dephospho-CoA kinase
MVLGLTGVIGSGKSTVRGLLEATGFRGIDCDAVVKELLQKDADVHQELVKRWGGTILNEHSMIDRASVAAIVFKNKDELLWLESRLHPRVRAYWQHAVNANSNEPWVIEVPLLFENSLEVFFNFTVCVVCSPDTQLKRLLKKGFHAEDVRARMANQLPIEEKIKRADYVLFNDGDERFLKEQVEQLVATISK